MFYVKFGALCFLLITAWIFVWSLQFIQRTLLIFFSDFLDADFVRRIIIHLIQRMNRSMLWEMRTPNRGRYSTFTDQYLAVFVVSVCPTFHLSFVKNLSKAKFQKFFV